MGLKMALDHLHALVHKAHLQHQPCAFDQNPGAGGIARFQRLPDGQRGVVVRHVEIVRRQTVIPLHLVGLGIHHPAILTDHGVGVAGGLIQRHQAAALGNVGFRSLQLLVQADGLVVVLGLDQGLHPETKQVLVIGVALRQVFKQQVLFARGTVGLRQQAQGIQPVGAHRRGRVTQPGLLAGQIVRLGLQRPLG